MRVKYVIVTDEFGFEQPVVFGETLTHAEVSWYHKRQYSVVSAGFVGFVPAVEGVKASCYGRSESLNLDSRGEEDEKLINKKFGLLGPVGI